MKSKILNINAKNETGVRPNVAYSNMLDQKRYMYALNFIRDKDVLDCASGVGWGSFLLANGGAKTVVGLDLSPIAINTSKLYYSSSNVDFILGDLSEIDLNKKFDVITSFETLEHVDNPLDFLRCLKKNIKPNGLLLLSTPNGYCTKNEGEKPYNPYHSEEFTRDELFQLLEKAGWCVDKYMGQHPIQEGAKDVMIYRDFNRQYWNAMRRIEKYGLFYRIFNKFRSRFFGLSSDPAQRYHCNPELIKSGFQPVYHYVMAHPMSE